MHAAMLEKPLSPSANRDRSFIATDGKAGTLPSLAGISEGGLRDTVHITEHIGLFELIFIFHADQSGLHRLPAANKFSECLLMDGPLMQCSRIEVGSVGPYQCRHLRIDVNLIE